MKLYFSFLTTFLFFVTVFSQNKHQLSLHHLVRNPTIKQVAPPLLILLHGVGSNEQDLFSFAHQIPGKYLVISVRAPIALGQDSYGWYHIEFSTGKPTHNIKEEYESRKKLIRFIEELELYYQYDKKEVYLCGFSQGGIMSYNIAFTRPDLIKGIAVMSGRLLEEIKPLIVKKEKLQHLKIFISHGDQDPLLPVQLAREANAYLKTLQLTPTYREYQAVHQINAANLADLINWLK
jgi:phospholipase/carboxylesterase